MKGDFSRSTYRPSNHYSSVRLQQGRVLLDAEWNEQADVVEHVERSTTSDVVGPSGAPKRPAGTFENFEVAVEPGAKDLRIAPGRIYVDGILCENDAPDGVLLTEQPDLPGATVPTADGNYAVYLDVWERHLTAVDQFGSAFPPLVDAALQGPDTATRTRVVWQVKLEPIDVLACSAFVHPAPPTGRLRASELKSTDPVDDCLVPSAGGYRRLENQLYRIEVHDDEGGNPRIKYSRDNASIVSKVKVVDAANLTIEVEDAGRDDVLGFGSATWVELLDEERTLRGESGALLEVSTVTGTSIVVTNPDGLSLATGTNPTLRRWDGRLTVVPATPVEVEDGVQVEIDGGTFTPGDHWLVPARTLTGRVEWPRDDANPPASIFESRHGPLHDYSLLAVVALAGGAFGSPTDCRELFPPLTDITASDVSYDPTACSNLATATTVQEAIDILCQSTGEEEPGIRVVRVTFLNGEELLNDSLVKPESLASGIRIACEDELFQNSVRNQHGLPNPVCRVTVDLPWPTNSLDRELWKVPTSGFIGFVTLTLAAQVNSDNNDIFWTPIEKAPNLVRSWIVDSLLNAVQAQTHGQVERVLCRLTLEGNFIWGKGAQTNRYLDGDTFGLPGDGHVDVQLPSGNGRRGGNLEMWFWLSQ
jgi:hypothetical protein